MQCIKKSARKIQTLNYIINLKNYAFLSAFLEAQQLVFLSLLQDFFSLAEHSFFGASFCFS